MNSPDFHELTDSYSDLPKGWMQSIPLMSSLLFHLCGLSIYAALALPAALLSEENAIHINVADIEMAAEAGSGESVSISGGPFEAVAAVVAVPEMMVATQITPGTTDLSMLTLSEELPPNTVTSPGGLSSTLNAMSMASQLGEASGLGSSTGTGTGSGGPNKRFFQKGVQASSAVFVIDASKSMNAVFEGRARTRFIRVKQELVSTIMTMEDGKGFFVIFFGEESYPMPAQHLVEVNDFTKRNYMEWAMQVPAIGMATIPDQALRQAISLNPEVIYFLTDGEFDRSLIDSLTRLNVRKIPIHTIGFNDRRNSNILLDLAQKNNGTYTYIPPDYD